MSDKRPNADDDGPIDRRTILRISSAAVASGAAFSGHASANRGRRRDENGGRRGRDDSSDGDTDELVVFCGCSQVCACDCPVDVYIAGAEDAEITGGSGCYETDEGQILAIEYRETAGHGGGIVCNPNTNCADFDRYEGDLDREDCGAQGARPRDGARCDDAFLDRCRVEG